ncbi:MAG: ligand-binding protein, partial [Treponema sp.]|nr:ligand-binding protein [Treponema sp.]
GTSRVAATFNNGEDYAYFVRRNKDWFRPESDLANAYIIRDGNIIPMDLTPMLYDASFYANTEIQANDTLIVPFRQYFVSVAGAVALPGRYPYIPNRTWDYYIGLAGGFDFNKNSFDSIKIRGADGKRLSKNDIITPETTITANSNSFYFKFNRYAPIITTTLTAIISVITVKTYLDSK